MTGLTLEQGLCDPHSGMNTVTHFSTIQEVATTGEARCQSPSGDPSNGGGEPGTGQCATSPCDVTVRRHRREERCRGCSPAPASLPVLPLAGVQTVLTAPQRADAVPGKAWSPRTGGSAVTPLKEAEPTGSWERLRTCPDQKWRSGAETMKDAQKGKVWGPTFSTGATR